MLRLVKLPYLQWPTPDSMIVMWETSAEAAGQVRCWQTERVHATGTGQLRTLDSTCRVFDEPAAPRRIHRVELTGLQPETLYHYQVLSRDDRGEACQSQVYPLKTAPGKDTPFSFAVTSETGGTCSDDYNLEIFAQLRALRPDLLLVAGDAVCHGSEYADWERFFFGPAAGLLPSTPFFLVPGNHEENAPWLYRFTACPPPGNYYAFFYGNAHFIGLDSTAMVEYQGRQPRIITRDGGFAPGAPQREFLAGQLRASRATWKIVFFHYPPYVSSDYQVDEMRVLCPLLEECGVDLVFNSHAILYERSHPLRNGQLDLERGVTYVVAGGAGARPEWFNPKRAWHTAHAVAVPHLVQVSVAGTLLELRAIDYQGRLFDLVQLRK